VAIGGLLVSLLVVFVVQNDGVIPLEFLVWKSEVSQSLLIALTLLSGLLLGVALDRWWRRRARRS
jgi:uncharacterized integral membrane protein